MRFDLLAASFPGGSITGAPKIRAMELIERLEPVRRGPYTGAALWMGPDGAMGSSILIRTLVADGARLTMHVGGGITWRSDPAAEWAETQAKAGGPLRALGAREVERVTAAPRSDRDTLLAVVSGVAVGLLALSFPSPIAFLGLIPAVIASLDLLRRRQLTAVGVLLVAAALSAGLPSGWTLFGASRAAGAGLAGRHGGGLRRRVRGADPGGHGPAARAGRRGGPAAGADRRLHHPSRKRRRTATPSERRCRFPRRASDA